LRLERVFNARSGFGATVQTEPGVVYQFGPYEVNTASGELLKNGRRIKLQEQPSRLLIALLENAGEVISHEELRRRLWPDHTFVDFDGSLRVAVRKLREALNDNAEDPRYIETIPKRGYRFLVPELRRVDESRRVPEPPQMASSGLSNGGPAHISQLAQTKRGPRHFQWWWLVLPCIGLIFFLIGRQFERTPATSNEWKLTQLTVGPGRSNASAMSPDGKLVAFSSDRDREGQFDLYVNQSAGGDPVRLTFDGNNNTSPDFSPDGSKIVFRSNRDGGGIFIIPAFGSEARLLAHGGADPKFSPDGSQVAYWIGSSHVASVVPGSGTVWVVPVTGGAAYQVGAQFTAARTPIWSPDGTHLLVMGYTSTKSYDRSGLDWWVVPLHGGPAVKTGFFEALTRQRPQVISRVQPYPEPGLPRPSCWPATLNSIVFSIPSGDASNIWETGIEPATGRINGRPTRLTTGEGNEWDPSCSSGDVIAFTSANPRNNIWAAPTDLNKGKALGKLQRLTDDNYVREGISLSRDGQTVVFSSNQSGTMNIWVRRADGQEVHLAPSSFIQRFPVTTASGNKIAYSSFETDRRELYLATLGHAPELICDICLRATDWTRDEKALLVFSSNPYQINLLDISSHQQTPLLMRAGTNLLYGRFSPDGLWVSFTMRLQPDRSWIMIAPVDGLRPIAENRWIKIAEGGPEDWANWSPDGRTLYYTSNRDGHTCLWAQRIDAVSHSPVGESFAVQHFHGSASYAQGGWAAAAGQIAIVLRDSTENIWMMSRSTAH
jgi:eukaryotic-like serine/threonine-protein kinase